MGGGGWVSHGIRHPKRFALHTTVFYEISFSNKKESCTSEVDDDRRSNMELPLAA
jgi:hypothetical protein